MPSVDGSKFAPKNITEQLLGRGAQPQPLVYEAVAGVDAEDILASIPVGETTRLLGGEIRGVPVVIVVDGTNIADVIADLISRVSDLETP